MTDSGAPMTTAHSTDVASHPTISPTREASWLATAAICQRELVRFFRQPSRLVGALAQPLVFWLLFGAGLGPSFHPPGAPPGLAYEEYFFPGILVLIVLFTAIFATISIIEDRTSGFWQGVVVAPAPVAMVVLGKVLGGTILALIQAWLFILAALAMGIKAAPLGLALITLWLFIVGFGLTSLGVCIAWKTESTQGFHAIMSVFLFPMWLLSEAFFPAAGAPTWLATLIKLNPLTYCVAGLRRLLHIGDADAYAWAGLPGIEIAALVTVGFSALVFWAAVGLAGRSREARG